MRFSLRTLLAVVSIFGIAIAAALYFTKGYRERRAIEGELLTLGARWVSVDDVEGRRIIRVVFSTPGPPAEIKKYERLGGVELQAMKVDAASLDAIAGLKQISGALTFGHCTFQDENDLALLAKIGHMRALIFLNTPVDDRSIAMIAQIPGLEAVMLRGTNVTQAGVDELRRLLPKLRVDYGAAIGGKPWTGPAPPPTP